jgi:hypothetical protein
MEDINTTTKTCLTAFPPPSPPKNLAEIGLGLNPCLRSEKSSATSLSVKLCLLLSTLLDNPLLFDLYGAELD